MGDTMANPAQPMTPAEGRNPSVELLGIMSNTAAKEILSRAGAWLCVCVVLVCMLRLQCILLGVPVP